MKEKHEQIWHEQICRHCGKANDVSYIWRDGYLKGKNKKIDIFESRLFVCKEGHHHFLFDCEGCQEELGELLERKEEAKEKIIEKVEKWIKSLESQSSHPLAKMKNQGIIAIPDGGWINFFKMQESWKKFKEKLR